MAQYTSTTRAWKAIDCSNDAQVAVAVVDGGDVHVTRNGGDAWTDQAVATRPWTCVAVSADGAKAIAMAFDGNVAIGTTTAGSPTKLNSWATSSPLPSNAWTDVSAADDFGRMVATAQGLGMFLSTNGGTTWTPYNNLLGGPTVARPWSCVALSGDGNFATAGATTPSSSLYVFNTGSAWYRFANTSAQRVLVEGGEVADKVVVNSPNAADLYLDGELDALGALVEGPFANNIYDYVSTRHHVYRVDCAKGPNPSPQVLLSTDTKKIYQKPDGNVVFSTDSPSQYIVDTFVGGGNVLVAQAVGGEVQLIHPWNTGRPRSMDLIVDPMLVKSIIPGGLTIAGSTFAIASAQNNHNIYLRWNNAPANASPNYVVTIPDGSYTVATLNQQLENGLDALGLYLTEVSTSAKRFFVRFTANPLGAGLRLEVDGVPRGSLTGTGYASPPGGPWPYATGALGPAIFIGVDEGIIDTFGSAIGFEDGAYPPDGEAPSSPAATYVKSADFVPSAWTVTNLGSAVATFAHSYEIYPDMHEAVGTLEPMLDYIVKESYYFAPGYDQYDTKVLQSGDPFQPRTSELPQKMVNAQLASGRYFGVAFGSFLFGHQNPATVNGVYTRGQGNLMKLFSFRPVTQLFSFDMYNGFLKDRTGTATTTATFINHVQTGNLYAATVDARGQKYAGQDTTQAFVQPTLDDAETGFYYDEATGKFVDTTMFLLGTATPDIVEASLGGGRQRAVHASVAFDMEDDPTSANLEVLTASTKTPLRRSAEFHLLFQSLRPELVEATTNNRQFGIRVPAQRF